jgi:tetratricopeptide (TPR) repeat protein
MTTVSPSKPDLFKNGVIAMLTLIGIFAAVVTFLQNYASLRSEDLVQQSEFTAVNSTGLSFKAGLEAAQGVDVQQRYEDYVQRAIRADTKARALRMGGWETLAGDYTLDAERWNKAAAEVLQSDPLLYKYERDADLYRETLSREAYVEAERQHTLLDQSRAWGDKGNRYVAVLSTLSVALFLGGLSLTLSSRVRYLLILAGVGLTTVCLIWVLFIIFAPVPRIPEAAIQHFVDGEIAYNLSNARSQAGLEALADLDAAIQLAPDYSRAYFYRSLVNTDTRLADKHLKTQNAINDGQRALALGNESSPVLGNLGWLYYLDGQYRNALQMTERALAMSPDECYLTLNRGLILLALERSADSEAAYTEAIACARGQSDYWRDYYLDVGVVDLEDLSEAQPDLASSLEPAIRRLKNTAASLKMFGEPEPHSTSAKFDDPVFGAALDSEDNLVEPAKKFPQTTTVVYAHFKYAGMKSSNEWLTRWLRDGREELVTHYPSWDYEKSGSTWVSIYNNAGLNPGAYELDIFVEGNLVASSRFTVLPGKLPTMTEYTSSDVGVTINYPSDWKIIDLADNEVSVIAARDPKNSTFFYGVVAYQATTGTDEDIAGLFDLYFGVAEKAFKDFSSEEAEAFLIAGKDGLIRYYTYTDAQGTPIQGAVAGVLNSAKKTVFLLTIETHQDDWTPNLDLFNVMLSRITLNEKTEDQPEGFADALQINSAEAKMANAAPK